jgi:pilus assembly protein FimV
MVRAVSIGAVTLLAMATVATGCGSSGGGGTAGTNGGAGTSGAAGTTGSAGTTGTAGSTGSGGAVSYIPACAALVPTVAAITDFPSTATAFGPFDGLGFSGSFYTYPPAVTQSFAASNWNMTGTVADYSGFGANFQCAGTSAASGIANVSAYQGIQFDISGTFTPVAAGGTAPAMSITFSIGTAPDDVASQYRSGFNPTDQTTWSYGTCVPASTQYDGSCAVGSKAIPFTATTTTVMVHWTDLAGAKPKAFDPKQITYLSWAFPWAGASSAQYTVNVTIDNLSFF